MWRPSAESLCTHRCPIWDDEIGLSPRRSIALDLLHTLHLEPMQSWRKMTAYLLLDAPIWGLFESTEAERHVVGVASMRAELMRWC